MQGRARAHVSRCRPYRARCKRDLHLTSSGLALRAQVYKRERRHRSATEARFWQQTLHLRLPGSPRSALIFPIPLVSLLPPDGPEPFESPLVGVGLCIVTSIPSAGEPGMTHGHTDKTQTNRHAWQNHEAHTHTNDRVYANGSKCCQGLQPSASTKQPMPNKLCANLHSCIGILGASCAQQKHRPRSTKFRQESTQMQSCTQSIAPLADSSRQPTPAPHPHNLHPPLILF